MRSLKLKSASCQIAYWERGKLRIANYLTGRTFSTLPATLDVIRFFLTPRTMQDALVEFRSYNHKSVAMALLQLIDAQLLLEYGSAEWKRDERGLLVMETLAPRRRISFHDQGHPVRSSQLAHRKENADASGN